MAGNMEAGLLPLGAGAGIITEILPAAEVVRRIVEEYDEVVKQLSRAS